MEEYSLGKSALGDNKLFYDMIKKGFKMFNKICLLLGCLGVLFFTGCSAKQAILSNEAEVNVLSNHRVVDVKTYRLPKGSLHGYSWEFEKDHAFEMWIVSKSKEFYVYIPVPDEFLRSARKNMIDEWDFEWNENSEENPVVYALRNKNRDISLEIKLPFENGKHYGFSSLTNRQGENMLLFGNLSDYIIHEKDKAVFGYVIVK